MENKSWIFLCVCLVCSSCGANYHLRKAERHLKKAELLGSSWRIDTVYKDVPFYVDSVRVDSIFIAKVGDTVVIEKERLKLRYIRLAGDSVFIEAECEADTVYQKVPIIVSKTIEAKVNWWKYFLLGFVSCFIILVLLYYRSHR